MSDRLCLQCNESEGAIRASQRARDPIYCAGGYDYDTGDVTWEADRHRFKDWTDQELSDMWRVLPEHFDKYRRILNAYEIDPEHRSTEREQG